MSIETTPTGRETEMIRTILAVVAVVLLVLAALGVNAPRVSLGWLGLAILAGLLLF
jgi:hypothetical protein